MPKWDWFDDFMIMKMMEEEETAESTDCSEGFAPMLFAAEDEGDGEDHDSAELLEALQEELSALQDELFAVECNEPSDSLSEAFARWEARRDLLEAQILL